MSTPIAASPSLYSPLWFRVATLRPRLRAHVQMRRQHTRGEHWMLLVDPGTGQAHRLDAAAWRLIGLCNGQRTLDEVWRSQRAALGDELPTQDELLRLVVQLHEAGLLHCPVAATDAAELFAQVQQRRRAERLAASNPLAFRATLGNPTRLLRALAPLGRALFSPAGFTVWTLMMVAAALAALFNAPRLAQHTALWWPQLSSLGAVWLLYPLVKAAHELAHGLAIRRLGGEVPAWGVSLLVLMPVPWVDARAANAMPLARHRMLVSAAGVMAELGLAALDFAVWLVVEPGVVADTAFTVMMIGGVSTLLANANPLLRLDGYFFATDALGLPNLALRSSLWWRAWGLRRLLGVQGEAAAAPPLAPGEGPWLIGYAPLAWIWRVVLAALSVSWLGAMHPLLGWAALALSVCALVAHPLWRGARLLRDTALPLADVPRARRRAGALAVAAVLVIAALPLPFTTTAQGVVWLPDEAWVRLPVDGQVKGFAAADGSAVSAGALLVELDNPELQTRRARVDERLAAAEAALYGGGGRGLPQGLAPGSEGGAAAARVDSLRSEQRALQQQIEGQQVRAGVAGTLHLPRQDDQLERWFERGTTLGHVLPPGHARVRVAVPQADAALMREDRLTTVSLRTVDAPAREYVARLVAATPAVTTALPSAALGQRSGGALMLDPTDPDGRTAREPVALIDVDATEPLGERVGTRATVRFDHGWQPLAWQLLRRARQLVLQRLGGTPT